MRTYFFIILLLFSAPLFSQTIALHCNGTSERFYNNKLDERIEHTNLIITIYFGQQEGTGEPKLLGLLGFPGVGSESMLARPNIWKMSDAEYYADRQDDRRHASAKLNRITGQYSANSFSSFRPGAIVETRTELQCVPGGRPRF